MATLGFWGGGRLESNQAAGGRSGSREGYCHKCLGKYGLLKLTLNAGYIVLVLSWFMTVVMLFQSCTLVPFTE